MITDAQPVRGLLAPREWCGPHTGAVRPARRMENGTDKQCLSENGFSPAPRLISSEKIWQGEAARQVAVKVEFDRGMPFPCVGFIVTNLETDSRVVPPGYQVDTRCGPHWLVRFDPGSRLEMSTPPARRDLAWPLVSFHEIVNSQRSGTRE